jgi:hypothetical protein
MSKSKDFDLAIKLQSMNDHVSTARRTMLVDSNMGDDLTVRKGSLTCLKVDDGVNYREKKSPKTSNKVPTSVKLDANKRPTVSRRSFREVIERYFQVDESNTQGVQRASGWQSQELNEKDDFATGVIQSFGLTQYTILEGFWM